MARKLWEEYTNNSSIIKKFLNKIEEIKLDSSDSLCNHKSKKKSYLGNNILQNII